jgi:MFS family permease
MQTLLNSEPRFQDRPAVSSAPWVWVGFIFAAGFLMAEFAELLLGLEKESFQFVFVIIVIGGWIYWLVCVHRFHRILAEMTADRYPIQPAEAVGKHFIPFYNLYWLFVWPSSLSLHINERGQARMVSGYLVGFLLLVSLLLRYVDGAVGLALTFAVGMYISAKLRKHMRAVKGVAPEMLPPPPPDPSLFRSEPAPGAAEVESEPKTQLS